MQKFLSIMASHSNDSLSRRGARRRATQAWGGSLPVPPVAPGGAGLAGLSGLPGPPAEVTGSVEALEHAYPFGVERYARWDESSGPGQDRGGAGVVRDYRVLADDIVVSLSSERQHVPSPGMAGGGAGACGAFVLNPGTPQERKLPSAAADVPLPRGSVLRICTPAGAGYGDAKQRTIAAVERDVTEGRISPDYASRIYLKGA